MSQLPLNVVPVTLSVAAKLVDRIHRHHGAPPPSLTYFCLGVVADGELCGVAIVGRPANRNSDDKQTAEVLRVATDGTPNACSALYGAAARAAKDMGFARIITYTLDTEPGSSLRGAGWTCEADGIESWWHRYPDANAKARRTIAAREHYQVTKKRWVNNFRDHVTYALPAEPDTDEQPPLNFGEPA